jgi:hypothetical protein
MTRAEHVWQRLTAMFGDEFARKFRPVGQTQQQMAAHFEAMKREWHRALQGYSTETIDAALDALGDGTIGSGRCPNLPELILMLKAYRPKPVLQIADSGPNLTPAEREANRQRLNELLKGMKWSIPAAPSGADEAGLNDQGGGNTDVAG